MASCIGRNVGKSILNRGNSSGHSMQEDGEIDTHEGADSEVLQMFYE